MKYVLISAAALALVAACGDGSRSARSGSSATPTPLSSFAPPTDGTYRANGMAVSSGYTTDAEGNVLAFGTPETEGDITADLTYEDGDLIAATLTTSTGSFTLSTAAGDSFDLTTVEGGFVATSADGDVMLVVADPEQQGYSYQTFGAWQTGLTGSSRVAGAGSLGVRTSESQMPTTGTASYYGDSLGQVVTDGQLSVTTSYIAVDTDFDTVEIYSSDTITADPATGEITGDRPDLDFYTAGSVSGTGFAADIVTDDLSGSLDGQFYGDNAQEVGGTFSGTTADSTYIGAFGAVDDSR
ncbi:transferrin-binding protein-like solute binding protein [Alloyangia pacifica]|uniref:transferrin-binding protein-like solute binding protein n=1 Tax=Alloyangia pacifica TaxID=311180 RepID=UPI001CFD4553|nr:transferrin-binding protein-like solute binding protein [Alloyangia pacifica]